MSTWYYQQYYTAKNDVTIKLVFGIGIHVVVPDVKNVIHTVVVYIRKDFFLGNWMNKMNGR